MYRLSKPANPQSGLARAASGAASGALIGATGSFVLSSLIVVGATPLRAAVCATGAILGVIIYWRWNRLAWVLLGVTLLAWCAVAFSPLAHRLTTGLVRNDPVPQSVDAVVVLSGSVTHDGMLGPEALDRLLTGLALVRAGRAPTLVITEPRPWKDRSITTIVDQRRLIALLPAEPRVVVIDGVINTRTEALGTARALPPATVHTIALVTSPMHTRRACRVFEHAGYVVTCVASESRDIALHSLSTVSDRLAAFRMAVSERAALALYQYRGWV